MEAQESPPLPIRNIVAEGLIVGISVSIVSVPFFESINTEFTKSNNIYLAIANGAVFGLIAARFRKKYGGGITIG